MSLSSLDNILTVFSFITLAAIILMFIPVIRRAGRRKAAEQSQAITFAANYWKQSLNDGNQVSSEKLEAFAEALQLLLVEKYAQEATIPDIGVYYYKPHEFGVDPIIWKALRWAGLVSGINRDINHHMLKNWVQMKVDLEQVSTIDGNVLFSISAAAGK